MKSDKQKIQGIFVNTDSYIKKEGMFKNSLKCSCSPAEKSNHRRTKFYIANWCWDRGLNFISEASFINGGRCDIVILDLGVGLEVLSSEKLKDCDKKEYPIPILKVPVKVSEQKLRDVLDDLLSTFGLGISYYQREGFK